MKRLKEHIRIQEEFYRRLENIYELFITRQEVSAAQFIKLIEVMNMNLNSHFTPEQVETLKKQSELLGREKVRDIQKESSELVEKVRKELDKGTSPDSPVVKKLAKRWKELTSMFTGRDPEITESAEKYYQDNPDKAKQVGMDKQLYEYIKKAF